MPITLPASCLSPALAIENPYRSTQTSLSAKNTTHVITIAHPDAKSLLLHTALKASYVQCCRAVQAVRLGFRPARKRTELCGAQGFAARFREGLIGMLRYVVKRVLLAILTVFIIAAITFFAMNAIPGGPFASEKAKDPAVEAMLMQRFHLDKPVGEQFLIYLGNLAHGDFGISLKTGREISDVISESFSVSATLGGMAAVLALVIGLVLGSVAALCRGRWPDRVIIFVTTLFVSVPSFILATILLLVFSLQLQWVGVWSPNNPNYVLPVIALALYPMAYITRLTKSSMLDVLGQDYIRTARAKGVHEWLVIFKHALRNALIPVITYVGPMTAYILTGSMVVETVFTVGGLGTKFVSSINNQDYPMIMAVTIFLAVLMVVATLLSDLIYKAVDPRIKLD